MKLASLIASLVLLASFAQAKDRYLVVFKSDQGYQAMKNYYSRTESSSDAVQSLDNVKSMVINTKNADYINSLKNHPEVALVEAEFFHAIPKPVNGFKMAQIARYNNVESFKGNKLSLFSGDTSSDSQTETPTFTAGDSTPWGILAVHAGDAWAQSDAGSRARVAVLDTGIDKNHPAIAPNFEKGRNFVADDSGKTDPTQFQDTEGHGTHCSGTILGAYNQRTGFTGVAPKAKLLMGRVCGTQGCSNIAVVQGINWAIQEKVDVISMSLGGPMGSSAEKTAVEKADSAGIVVVAASGNSADGPDYSPDVNDPKCSGGSFFNPTVCGVSYPAAFPTVVAVGALNSDLVKTNFSQWGPELDVTAPGAAVISSVPMGSGRDSKVELTVNGETTTIKSAAFSGTELFTAPVVNSLVAVPGVGNPEDFAKVNVAGKFALVSRGEIKFADKVKNAIDAKAVGVIIYNNTSGLMQGALSEDGSLINMPVVMIEQSVGQSLAAQLAQGTEVSASVATLPSDYASFDGTSMATPHVAGVVALIRSANKKLTPAQVRAILKSTAKPLSPNDANQYGAGLVQADAAVRAAVAQ